VEFFANWTKIGNKNFPRSCYWYLWSPINKDLRLAFTLAKWNNGKVPRMESCYFGKFWVCFFVLSRATTWVWVKIAQNVAQSIICPNKCVTWLLLKFSQKLSKVNTRPMGENSPNLVTLVLNYRGVLKQCLQNQQKNGSAEFLVF
jgi:hypothetical protein